MSYLEESWRAYDAPLLEARASDEMRDKMRISFYLGVKAMLVAIADARKMEESECAQFFDEILNEWKRFGDECRGRALEIIMETLAQALETDK